MSDNRAADAGKLWLGALACFVVFTALGVASMLPAGSTARLAHLPHEERVRTKQKNLAPSEYFTVQRAYPGTEIPHASRLRGFAQARDMRAAAVGRSAGAVWQQAGPTNIGGRITSIGYNSADPLRIYIGTADGGILRSLDFGFNWTALFDDQNTLSIGAVAVHPNDSLRLLAGTGEANSSGDSYAGTGIYESTDGGDSWVDRGLTDTRHIGRVVYDPIDPNNVFVAAMGALYSTTPDRGVYRSTDAGQSWNLVHSVNDSTGCVDVVINPTNPDIVYAAFWERIRRPHDRKVGGPSSSIWRSTDGGDSWSLLSAGLPAPSSTVGRIGLAIAPTNPDVLYAIYATHPGAFLGMFKTTNGGDSWFQVNDGQLSNMYSSFGWYFGNVRVHPTNEDIVYGLGLDTHRSTNGGNSWSSISGSIHVDQHDLAINSIDPNLMIAGNDGGVFTSINGGSSWMKSPNLPITQFYAITVDFQEPHRLYGGTQDNFTLRTLTGGTDDWEAILGGDGFYCSVDYNDNSYIYAEYQFGGFNRSTNGGNSFSSALNGVNSGDRRNWSTPAIMDPVDPQTLYYGTHRLYRTTNHASNWSSISSDLTNGAGNGSLTFGTLTTVAVAPTNTQHILAGTDDGNVWITTNGGGSWTHVSGSLPTRWVTRVAFDPADASIGYVTVSGFRLDQSTPYVFRTTDTGTSWTDITGNLPQLPVNVIVVDPEDTSTLYVGNDADVYASHDTGANWSPLGSGLPHSAVSDMHLHNPTRTLVAGTHGRSMWTLDLSQTTAIAASDTPARPALLSAPHPTPFRSSTRFVAEQPQPGAASFVIYDVAGRRVAALFEGTLEAGTHTFGWDGRDDSGRRVASGVYLARLENAGQVSTQKVVFER